MKKWNMPGVVVLDINATANGTEEANVEQDKPSIISNGKTYKGEAERPSEVEAKS